MNTNVSGLLRTIAPCGAAALLAACGGGSSGSTPGVTTYAVSATAGAGGSISPASTTVDAGGTTRLTVTAGGDYVIGGVTGCGGTLSGNTYTTGMVNASCTVTASFEAAFTWVSGSDATDAAGVYGTQGTAAAANVPGARDDGAAWTDASGNLWMFGGFAGYAGAANGNFLNDLWKYSPSSGEWTWVGGSNAIDAQGVYGSEGVAAPGNVPGARSNTVGWTDASGNFWLFGGGSVNSAGAFVLFNDLWEYSPASGEWAWMGGSSSTDASGVYGTEGAASAANVPGARSGSVVWKDANGNVWLFGGYGYDSGTAAYGYYNDLWEYSPSSGEWTWMGGSSTFDAGGVYGTQGAAAGPNVPGARYAAVSWTDANGNFWLFGGYGYDSTGQLGELNDLWEYSPSTHEWTWVGGSDGVNVAGTYGTQGAAAAANVPSARDGAGAWMDASGNLWLFGGEGFVASTGYYHRLNDLWKYSPASGEWTWVTGSDTFDATGTYGTQGMPAVSNVPGARAEPMIWTDGSGNAWLFGGYQYDDPSNTRFEMNDLWKYPTQ